MHITLQEAQARYDAQAPDDDYWLTNAEREDLAAEAEDDGE